ncbi:MAG: hypothetical protein KDE19_19410 [Caldilineaceae bacterium]|nr:hypothetical protein [Caldilineaceae bacterium]
MIFWYSLPVTILFAIFFLQSGDWEWALIVAAVMGTSSYLSIKWEVNRCYLPQIDSLKALRAKLVAP